MPSDHLTGFSSAFDDLLERSRRELDALSHGSGAPALSPNPQAPSRPSSLGTPAAERTGAAGASPSASRSPAERALDEKLGPGWRYEVLDRAREGGELVVRCRVTAPARGVTRTWLGSAPLSGAGRGGASEVKGMAGNVSFTLGGGGGTGSGGGTHAHDTIRAEREAERRAVESALAACARLF